MLNIGFGEEIVIVEIKICTLTGTFNHMASVMRKGTFGHMQKV